MYISGKFIESLLYESRNKSSDICSEVDKDNFFESRFENYIPDSSEESLM
jgi:hypothetical protein